MKNKATIAIVAGLVMLLVTGGVIWAAQAHAGLLGDALADHPMKRLIVGKIGRLMVLKSELNVTDEQRKKIKEIIRSHMKEIEPVAKQVVNGRNALRQAVMADQPNEQQIRAAAKEMSKSIGDAAVLASKVIGQARPVFTPDQQKRVREFMKSNHEATLDWLKTLSQ